MQKPFLNHAILSLVLLGVAFLLYGNTLSAGFVWDDHYLIEENQNVKNVKSVSNFFTKDFWQNSSINFKSGFYRPVTLLSFFVNYHLWQGHPFGFHFFNVLLHALNGILIFSIFMHATKNRTASFLSGLVFIAHPVQTESVAYIADVNDLLCVCFILLGVWFYLRAELNRIRYFAWSAGCLWLALLSKENAMAAFILIPLVDWFFIARFDWGIFKSKKWIFFSYLCVTLFYILIRILVLGKDNAVTTLQNIRYVSILPSFDLWSHILTVMKIVFLYLKLLFGPLALSISYVVLPAVSLFSSDVFFAAFFLLTLIALVFLCRDETNRWISFSILWFLIAILPVSNVVPISNTIAERFLYLPMVGFCVFLGHAFYYFKKWLEGRKFKPVYFYAAMVLIFSIFSYKTVTRNLIWQSDLSLFTSAIGEAPCSPIAHRNLSAYYYQQKDMARGLAHNQAYAACVNAIQQEYTRLKQRAKR